MSTEAMQGGKRKETGQSLSAHICGLKDKNIQQEVECSKKYTGPEFFFNPSRTIMLRMSLQSTDPYASLH